MEEITLQNGDALLAVDVQLDFLPGGALGVQHGDEVIRPLNRCLTLFTERDLAVFASRDWHTPDHISFHARGGPWPPHCVAGTHGAAFAESLHLPPDAGIVSKASTRDHDAYSAFGGTDLERQLAAKGVRRLFIGGLATDYCVVNSVRDALALGYTVFVLQDAVRAVDVQPGDGERALAEMTRLGAHLVNSAQVQG
jgi:nicotinamidase/pyrazinamidase